MYKKLIATALIAFSLNASAQKDSAVTITGSARWVGDEATFEGGTMFFNKAKKVNDTIRVVMFYTDTVSYYKEKDINIKFSPDWMYGYSVTPYVEYFSGARVHDGQSIFLDNNKSPLKKTIIVWLSKQL